MVRTDELVAARKRVKATQEDAANAIGCSTNTYCAKENNVSSFTVDEAVILCNFLKITSDIEKSYIFLA